MSTVTVSLTVKYLMSLSASLRAAYCKVCAMQGGSIRPPKQPKVPARDHGEGGDRGGDG